MANRPGSAVQVTRALETIEHSHVAVLMIDASRGLVHQDKVIADRVCKQAKSCILVGNKCDLLDGEAWKAFEEKVRPDPRPRPRPHPGPPPTLGPGPSPSPSPNPSPSPQPNQPYKVRTELAMIRWAPLVRASALTGEGIDEAMELVVDAGRWRRERLPKGPLNDVFQDALMIRPLPRTKTGGAQKVRYVLQLETETPAFVLHMNRDVDLHPSDHKYLENTIRKRWPYTATPLRLQFKGPDRKRNERRRAATSVPQRLKRRPSSRSARVQGS